MSDPKCRKCEAALVIGENWSPGYATRRVRVCKRCHNAYCVARRRLDPAKARAGYKKGNRTITSRYRVLQRLARKRGEPLGVTLDEYERLQQCKCAYCGGALPETGHGLDRKDNTLGYVEGNVIACCHACNKAKSDVFTYDEMKVIGAVIAQVMKARETE